MAEKKGKHERELNELKQRITEELKMMKQARFPNITDRAFEDETGVSRASLPGVESNASLPDVRTLYLWTVGCGSSLAELFRAPSGEYADETRDVHRMLEFILKSRGSSHWLAAAIRSEYEKWSPPPRVRSGKPPSQDKGTPKKLKPAAV